MYKFFISFAVKLKISKQIKLNFSKKYPKKMPFFQEIYFLILFNFAIIFKLEFIFFCYHPFS
ncbi:hypothetical protein BOO83_07635 [Campylobacter coli]|nr:hypothetical protein BOO83_07635 [Campylobacter coli]